MDELSLFGNLPVPASLLTKDGVWIEVNKSFEEFFERSHEEVIGLPLEELYAKKDRQKIRATLEKCKHEGKSSCEVEMIRGDGSVVPIIMNLSAVKDENGDIRNIIFTATDASMMKNVYNYYNLIDSANSVVMRMDTNGVITFLNKFGEELFGYTKEEIIGKNAIGTIIPETESTGRDLREMIRDVGKHPDKYKNNINENMKKTGERLWVLWTNRPVFDEYGNITEILCIGDDITSLITLSNKLEMTVNYLESVLEHYPDTLLILDEKSTVRYISPRFEEDFGYRRDLFKDLDVKVLKEKIVPSDERDILKGINESVKLGKRVTNYEITLIDKKGRIINAALSGSPLIDKKTENIIGIIVSIRDIERDYKEYIKDAKMLVEKYEKNKMLYNR